MSATTSNANRVLGRGSTATVYLSSDHLFAIKSSPIGRSQLLQHEHRILSSLPPSPHVIHCLGHETTADSFNLFLEYAPGGSLSDHLRHHPVLSEADIRLYTRDILLGLAHLHTNSIAHCDVKPQNVLVMHDGRAKIADLGCAAYTNEKRVQLVMGTPMFMAPEVARGQTQGPEADVWALGCTIIEMATGKPVWPEATNAAALLHSVGFSDASPKVPEWLSEEARDFLEKCLERKAGERSPVARLLEHSFLADCTFSDSNLIRVSPRSILDQDVWNSYPDTTGSSSSEQETVANRPIGDIFGAAVNNGPNWTWDENWVTVRDEEEAAESVGDLDGNSSNKIFYEFICSTEEIICRSSVLDDSLLFQLADSFCQFARCLCCVELFIFPIFLIYYFSHYLS